MPPRPPLNVPGQIHFVDIPAGSVASANGGEILRTAGTLTARLEGDSQGVFSIVRVEARGLERISDPDVPGVRFVWVREQSVDGPGPIALELSQAMVVNIAFHCPVTPSQDTFTASLLASASVTAPPLLQIPITGTVSPGVLTIESLLPQLELFSGQTTDLPFRIRSTRRRDEGGILTCDAPQGSPFTSDTNPQFPLVPAGGSVNVPLAISCAPGTPAGFYPMVVRFRRIDHPDNLASLTVTARVAELRSVSVTTNLQPRAVLEQNSTTRCAMHVRVSGGPTRFRLSPVRVPHGVKVVNAEQVVAIDRDAFLGFDIEVSPQAPAGPLSETLALQWVVDGDDLHPAASGEMSFGIEVVTVEKTFVANMPGAPIDFPRAGDVECTGATITLVSDGAWEFSGSLHDHGTLVGDKASIAFVGNFTEPAPGGGTLGFASPFVLVTLGAVFGGTRDFHFLTRGRDEFLRLHWPKIFDAGITIHMEATADPGQPFSDLADAMRDFFKGISGGIETSGCVDPQGQPVDCSTGEPPQG